MKKITVATILLALSVLTSACNTMEGVGQDMQKGGQDIQNSAEKNK